jgi:hypothetical protein
MDIRPLCDFLAKHDRALELDTVEDDGGSVFWELRLDGDLGIPADDVRVFHGETPCEAVARAVEFCGRFPDGTPRK